MKKTPDKLNKKCSLDKYPLLIYIPTYLLGLFVNIMIVFEETFFPAFSYKTVSAEKAAETVKTVDKAIKWQKICAMEKQYD